ncbi:hypothetical protein EPUS_07846 [Endocarpon pusillum Z07020]|uniref:Cytochrome P450 n=1 Tax=Endocarpon pusillum (strain Z07020 / HMAS-L-300199) TaxID=1263415 RepID=U1FX46_ENDPU|nr:uncharacterized protein EPUS_07846 [Endocarpon pusillum Z07020]ERF69442.1 hypothetical protein EPUS_07846 [Endocarpon pusillum Z07020]
MSSWSQYSSQELQLDVNGLTLAVISLAGFERRLAWVSNLKDTSDSMPQGYKMSFLKAMNDTTHHMISILLLPQCLLRLSPKWNAAPAHSQLSLYLRKMIRNERRRIESASEATASVDGQGKERENAFTEDKVMGNVFIYLLAGYETTANAILYDFIVLALLPELQARMMGEIDRVYADAAKAGRTELTYGDNFEKLQYTYDIMVLEAFRLFPGVVIDHEIGPRSHLYQRCLSIIRGDHAIFVTCWLSPVPHSPATHYSEHYRSSLLTLDPRRWVEAPAAAPAEDATIPEKKVVAAHKTRQVGDKFFIFSDGARACLGSKVAQAEYITFPARLFHKHQVIMRESMDAVAMEKD